MLDVLRGIFDALTGFIGFFLDRIDDLVMVAKYLRDIFYSVPDLTAWLPAAAGSLILSIFSFAVLYKILGRT